MIVDTCFPPEEMEEYKKEGYEPVLLHSRDGYMRGYIRSHKEGDTIMEMIVIEEWKLL